MEEVFEPNDFNVVAAAAESNDNVLAKQLLHKHIELSLWENFDSYDKKIHIVRDPRDRLVSALLYGGAFHTMHHRDVSEIKDFINTLEEKEEKSRDISVLEMLELTHRNLDELLSLVKHNLSFYARYSHYFLIKYEDFIESKIGQLENYLGFSLLPQTQIPSHLNRVIRTKSKGAWSLWFTQKDVEFFKPHFKDYMSTFDYNDDWQIEPFEKIPSAHCSEYVKKVLNEKRVRRKYEPIEW